MKDKNAPTIQDLEDLPPFHSAARQGDIDQLSQLLSLHPDLIDYGDGKGYTPLMHAVCASSIECVKLLLNSGSKPESKDRIGRTALILSSLNGWPEGCELIIEYGGKCQTVDANGRNALHYSSCSHNDGPITTSTLSRWVKGTLKIAGIGSSIFTSHSTRAASISRAKSLGLSLQQICKAAGWTNSGTFGRYYDKPVEKTNFSEIILDKLSLLGLLTQN